MNFNPNLTTILPLPWSWSDRAKSSEKLHRHRLFIRGISRHLNLDQRIGLASTIIKQLKVPSWFTFSNQWFILELSEPSVTSHGSLTCFQCSSMSSGESLDVHLNSHFFNWFSTSSIRQYYNNRQYLTSDQKKELSRRCVNMLLYVLRSPFYDQYSCDKIDSFMRAVSRLIPFAKLIVEPYRAYVPQYQESYFYMWSS